MVLAIDPGTIESAYVLWDGKQILEKGKIGNYEMRSYINNLCDSTPDMIYLAMEMVASYGMPVGQTTFETCVWTGRLIESYTRYMPESAVNPIFRKDVKMHHCHRTAGANDSTIRRALIDRFEPTLEPKQRPKGILKGVSKDIWSALAIAVLFSDTHKDLF